MACISLFLTGKETRAQRSQLRKQMMDYLYQLLFATPDRLSETCFTHASVRALVNRLHAIQPEEIPKSAEILYIRDEERMKRECMAFIMQNRREGYIGDMFTFFYLACELYKIDVHLHYHEEEVHLSVVAFAKYHLHIQYNGERFNLLLPRLKLAKYVRPTGIIRHPSRTNLPRFKLTSLGKALVPPNILGYRVHYYCIYDKGLHAIEVMDEITSDYAYVFGRVVTSDRVRCISCASRQGQCGPRFYVDVVPFEVYVVEEHSVEGALQAVKIEKRL